MLQLKTTNQWPPGGFPFVDPKTGMNFDAMSADMRLQVQNVIKHRRANPTFYPPSELLAFDPDSVKAEIVAYICAKRPQNCFDAKIAPIAYVYIEPGPPAGKKCSKCGSDKLVANYCKTCSGRRIKSWNCAECGTSNPV